MDFQPVFTSPHHGLAANNTGVGVLATRTRSRGAWELAASSVRLLSDFREAPGMGPRAAGRAWQRLSQVICASNRVRVHTDGLLPVGPCILVCNHRSFLDPVIVASSVPCLPITKAEVTQWLVVGELARRYGALFVQPGSTASSYRVLRSALAHLQEGGSIVNFPEGDTSAGRVGRFRRGVFGLAALAEVPIVPVAVAMSTKMMRTAQKSVAAHYVALMKEAPHDVFVRFGKPLPSGQDAKLLARLARARVQGMVEELQTVNGLWDGHQAGK